MSASSANAPLRLTEMRISDITAVLRRGGARHLTEERLRGDIEAGAPVNADGTVNLIHYAAWLAREADSGD